MRLQLTPSDLARSEFATRVLLSPLNVPSIDDWRSEVNRTLRELFEADHALFILPQAGAGFFSDDLSADTQARLAALFHLDEAGQLRSSDRATDRILERRRQQHVETYTEALFAGDEAFEASAFYRNVMAPSGLAALRAIHATSPQGEAVLWLFFRDAEAGPFGEAGPFLLRALLPAFKAGIEMFARLEAHRAALDAISEPLLVLDLQGRELHRNRAFTNLLKDEPDADRLLAEAYRESRTHGGDLLRLIQASGADAAREVRTPTRQYRLRSTVVTPGILGSTGTIMVAFESAATPVLPSAEALRAHFGLTRREAEVTLLMAEGLSNQDVADRLFVSAHTARRHTESVLSKLGLRSRKAIALKLLEINQPRRAARAG